MSDPEYRPIPQPPEKPLLGNILDLSPSTQVQDLMKLARRYGELFHLQLSGRRLVVVSGASLVEEVCDESRFDKRIWAPLRNVRAFAGDGLFTAYTYEQNWQTAHRVLMPSFGMPAMRSYHLMMLDIAHQLVERWEHLNPGEEVDVADQMTRLTLDTIGLCGFDYRFNSFHRDRPHPFIKAMTLAMKIAMGRSARPAISTRLNFRENQRFRRAVDLMNTTVDDIIKERRAAGAGAEQNRDLLSQMLSGSDPETGEVLDDLNIRYQIITFLIAGHETTSGLLSFTLYFLLKHPAVAAKVLAEIDDVVGADSSPTYDQVRGLTYLRQVLNESLRLWPTAPMFALFPKEERTTLGGAYQIDQRDIVAVLVPMLHRDSRVWGHDAEVFNPDHFSTEAESSRSPHSFKPFGNGQRACIGRQFAMHEATLALAMLLQRFQLVEPHGYQLKIRETLTLKPADFRVRVLERSDRAVGRRPSETVVGTSPPETPAQPEQPAEPVSVSQEAVPTGHGTPLHVLFGSNMGTSEAFAHQLADAAAARGYAPEVVALDELVGRLPQEGAVLILCASYNGMPPDNARRFVEWLESDELPRDALVGVDYCVFGCGHRDWASTYQFVPTLIDELLERHGARRLIDRAAGDAGGDIEAHFESWERALWPVLRQELGLEGQDHDLEIGQQEPSALLYEVEMLSEQRNVFADQWSAELMEVVANRELQSKSSERSTRHLEVRLPPGVSYVTGDHLGVLPRNSPALVKRALTRLGAHQNTRVKLHQRADGVAHLPLDEAITLARLLEGYVELQEAATRSQLRRLQPLAQCPPDQQLLDEVLDTGSAGEQRYDQLILAPERSLLDVLDLVPSVEVPIALFLELLPPLRPRYYSISSSPRVEQDRCSLTVAVLREPSWKADGSVFEGTCSTHLERVRPGDLVQAFVSAPQTRFRLPQDPRVPLIMIGPGTGLAPFRGFLQERLALIGNGERLGESLLFFGCRHPDQDFIYGEELEEMVERGALGELVVAFSRLEPDQKVYVQHRLTERAEDVWRLLEAGARVYVCGDARGMEPGVRDALVAMKMQRSGADEAAARTVKLGNLAREAVLNVLPQKGIGSQLRRLGSACTALCVPLRGRRPIAGGTAARRRVAAQLTRNCRRRAPQTPSDFTYPKSLRPQDRDLLPLSASLARGASARGSLHRRRLGLLTGLPQRDPTETSRLVLHSLLCPPSCQRSEKRCYLRRHPFGVRSV